LLPIWPDVRPLPAPERIPRAWSEPQIRLLFAALSKQEGTICGLSANEWWICQHLFFWDTAERLDAAFALRVHDLDLTTGWIVVRAETRKGKTRDRAYRLHPQSLARFRIFVAHDPERKLMFPIDFCRESLWNRYRAILKAAGLPHGRESMFHRMRKSAISHFKKAGGDSCWLADHSDPATTRKSYEDPTIIGGVQACDLLFRPIDDGPAAA
jgi:integrase